MRGRDPLVPWSPAAHATGSLPARGRRAWLRGMLRNATRRARRGPRRSADFRGSVDSAAPRPTPESLTRLEREAASPKNGGPRRTLTATTFARVEDVRLCTTTARPYPVWMSPPFRLRLLRRASAWLLVLAPGCGGRATSFVEGRDGGTGTGQTGDASAGGESGQGSGADAADVWSALSDAGSAGAEPGDVWSAPFDGASTDSEPGDAWSAPFDAASTDANASDEWSATSDAGSADAEPSDAPAAYPCESPQDCAAHHRIWASGLLLHRPRLHRGTGRRVAVVRRPRCAGHSSVELRPILRDGLRLRRGRGRQLLLSRGRQMPIRSHSQERHRPVSSGCRKDLGRRLHRDRILPGF